MARHGARHRAKAHRDTSRWPLLLKTLALAVLLLAAVVILTGRDEWPPAVRDNAVVIRLYDLRDRLVTAKTAPAPAAQEHGYIAHDRKALEEIITEGEKN